MAESAMTEKLKKNKGVGQEETELGLSGEAGLYRHPDSGAELHTRYDPLLGNAQSEAAIRVGFQRVRDSRPEELKELATPSEQHNTSGSSDEMKGILARLNAQEADNARLREQLAKDGKGQTELSQSAAMAEADARTAERVGETNGTPAEETPAVSDKPLAKQNKTELLATAKALGVEGVSSDNTNKELVLAIEAKQA